MQNDNTPTRNDLGYYWQIALVFLIAAALATGVWVWFDRKISMIDSSVDNAANTTSSNY